MNKLKERFCHCNPCYSNCEDIDRDLYGCAKCGKDILPYSLIDRFGNRTSLTIRAIWNVVIVIFDRHWKCYPANKGDDHILNFDGYIKIGKDKNERT
jgi:hypothetical protein